MLLHRLRRWHNIKPALVHNLVFAVHDAIFVCQGEGGLVKGIHK